MILKGDKTMNFGTGPLTTGPLGTGPLTSCDPPFSFITLFT